MPATSWTWSNQALGIPNYWFFNEQLPDKHSRSLVVSEASQNNVSTPVLNSTPCGGEVLHVCLKMSRTKRPM